MPPLSADDAERVFRRATDDYQAGRLDSAIAGFRQCLELDPKLVGGHVALGVALHNAARHDEAIASLRRATALAPDSYDAAYHLAVVLAEQRQLDDAIAAYRAALAIQPQAPAALINLGLLLKERDLDEAVSCFTRAVAAAPHVAAAHAALGNALHDQGQRPAALAALRRSVELEPQSARWQVNFAEKLIAGGEFAPAAAALRRALANRPGDAGALSLLPVALQHLGAVDEAQQLLDYAQVLRAVRLERVEGWANPGALNAALAEFVYRHPTLQRDPPGKATQHGSQTLEIFFDTAAPMQTLRRFIVAAVGEYMRRVFPAAPTHFPVTPNRWEPRGWAVVLRSGGHQTAHYHPYGLISGVYYVQIPEAVRRGESEAGCIRFGDGLPASLGALANPLTATVKPEPGLLLLFPSSFWHRTIPFESREDRICIAFDVIATA